MILRVTRHGQPAIDRMAPGANYELPDGDYPLTALGREQAQLLGEHLKKTNFKGMVFSSPYARTMETASIAAGACGLDIIPEPALQEIRFYPEPPCPGMTLKEMQTNYPNIAPGVSCNYPWMTEKGPEDAEDVRKRVVPFLESLIAEPPANEVLLVGHGASVGAVKSFMIDRAGFRGYPGYTWNASLSTFEVHPDGKVRIIGLCTIDFMPLEKVTSNKRLYGDPECV